MSAKRVGIGILLSQIFFRTKKVLATPICDIISSLHHYVDKNLLSCDNYLHNIDFSPEIWYNIYGLLYHIEKRGIISRLVAQRVGFL